MPSTMTSRLAVLAALNAVGLAAPQVPSPSTTEAMQSFLSISDLDAVQV